MALPTGQPAAGMQDGNLKSLLDAIDRKTAPALQQDLERLHSRAGQEKKFLNLFIDKYIRKITAAYHRANQIHRSEEHV